MDVQELKQFESVYQPSKEIAFCWGVKRYVQLSLEENHTDIVDHANDSLRIWQAAKAHEAEKLKGCVIVPKTIPENVVERLKNSSYHWGENTKDYFSPIYKMMVEEAARVGNE